MPTSRPRLCAGSLAALLTVAAVCAGDAVARVFPFGPHTRSVNDLGNQFVPFHARLWDLLHGNTDGGLLLNWSSGYGTSFLPDLGTYLTSPFALLVGVFPRDRIDLAVYVVTVLKMASAAALMALFLLTLRGGRWWAAGALGGSYALCGWSVAEASYNPMWLDGLIALPLLCLVAEWARTGRHRIAGPLLVAVVWAANFYTAYMATLGAALVLAVRLFTERDDRRAVVRGLVRAVCTVGVGIGLSAPVLLPVYLGTKHAYPGWERTFAPAAWPDVLARLLPATYSFFTPALFLGTGTLLLACAPAFQRSVPGRERWAWAGLVAGVALSLQWGPTHLLWHAFATPNGSPYRQTFVLAGLVVIAAWVSVSYGWPGRRALLGGVAVLVLLAAGAGFSDLVTGWTYPLFAGGLVAAACALVLVGRGRRLAALAAVLLIGAQAGQAAAATAYFDRQRLNRLDDYAPWGERQRTQAAVVAGADGWPGYRTDPGREQTTTNDPLLVGGQGGAYYSSHTPAVLTRTMRALGGGWTSNGRAVQSLDNPVTDAVFSVGARVRGPRDPHQGANAPDDRPVTVSRAGTPPLVTVRGAGGPVPYGRSPFRNQEQLLGSRVYTVPTTALRTADGGAVADKGAYDYRVGRGTYTLTAACPAGTEAYLWSPDMFGWARLGDGPEVEFKGQLPARRAAMQHLGTVGGGGSVRVTLTPVRAGTVPHQAVGCLDRARLASAVAGLKRTGATAVHVTDHGVRAELPPGTTGTVVIAAPRIAGWSCQGRPADSYLGLVATPAPADGTAVDCSFRPPGLRAGAVAGAGALAVLVLGGLVLVYRRRGAGSGQHGPDRSPQHADTPEPVQA
ncbi:YfhO family protein [Streptomyces sp. NBC_01591]|uniref:YfhO family protein n=1 Tax=Streptomyces sp. NBC_01591 TaxID=2975888 RepID=UPI002DD99532|nr:YfhO family protein [Streptomyces sp. NBC_01591]WSD68887.1 YfhO family protein [Streptomyces sp. NBC_01591]